MTQENEGNLVGSLGTEFGNGLRRTSNYTETQEEIERSGITEHALSQTPPIGLNLELISKMPITGMLRQEFNGKPLHATMLGLSIPVGVTKFKEFIETDLQASIGEIHVVEIDSEIVQQIAQLQESDVNVMLRDARKTGLGNESQDIVIRDHLGNCCPPEIDEAIDAETWRILKPGGIAIVDITTSENLLQSEMRGKLLINQPNQTLTADIQERLRSDIYDLHQLKRLFGDSWESIRSQLIEIDPESFVIFGEDNQGHAEWFRRLEDHMQLWEKDGFELLEMQTRIGPDSHIPPLQCVRHNVILRKVK